MTILFKNIYLLNYGKSVWFASAYWYYQVYLDTKHGSSQTTTLNNLQEITQATSNWTTVAVSAFYLLKSASRPANQSGRDRHRWIMRTGRLPTARWQLTAGSPPPRGPSVALAAGGRAAARIKPQHRPYSRNASDRFTCPIPLHTRSS